MARSQHAADLANGRLHALAQGRADADGAAALRAGVEERTFGYRMPAHLFQAERLPGQLQVVAGGDGGFLVAVAVLVFDRVGAAVGQKLDHVGLADQAEPFAPQRQRPLHPQPGAQLDACLVRARMDCLAALGVEVVLE